MPHNRVVDVAHELLAPVVAPGSFVLDATAGQGHDAAWLASRVGAQGKVFVMDLQQAAIDATRTRLSSLGLLSRCVLRTLSHAQVLEGWPELGSGQLQAAIINLGYLPQGSKEICTRIEETEPLIEWILGRLGHEGRMVCCVYPGHPEGARESARILQMAAELPPKQGTSWVHRLAQRGSNCPWIWTVQRRLS